MSQKLSHAVEWAYCNMAQRAMYPLAVFAAVVIFTVAAAAVMAGHWALLMPGMVIVAVGGRVVLRLLYESPRDLWEFMGDMRSLSFAFGQTIILPITLAFAARGWQDVPTDWRWALGIVPATMGLGCLFGCVNYLVNKDRHLEAGTYPAMLCPTMVWHRWVVVPVTTALLAWLLAPQLLGGTLTPELGNTFTGFTRAALVFLMMFGLLVMVDYLPGFDVRRQGVLWDPKRFMPADTI